MVDTPRTESELLTIFADNTSGAISPQDMRDFVVSITDPVVDGGLEPEVLPHGPTVSTLGDECGSLLQGGTYGTGTNWPATDLGLFFPFRFREVFSVVRGFIVNGATPAGNFDIGVYAVDGTRLASSGSTAQSGASDIQLVTLTYEITEDLVYLALSASSTSFQLYRTNSFAGLVLGHVGAKQMANAFPLPSSATLVPTTNAYFPVFGVAKETYI